MIINSHIKIKETVLREGKLRLSKKKKDENLGTPAPSLIHSWADSGHPVH